MTQRLEAELLEQPLLALVLLVLGLEDGLCLLEELLLDGNLGEGVGGEGSLERLGHGALDAVPGWHNVGEVDHLDEWLDGGALLDELLHLWGWLAHGAGDWQRGLGNADNDAVAVWALLGVVIHGFQDDSLLACVAALEEHDDLSVLKTAQQPRSQVQAEGSYLRLSPARFY